jgi:glycerol-3-phosphate acyltransferase PlsX
MTIRAKPTIGVDLMGGDHSPINLISGILDLYQLHPLDCHFIFYCQHHYLETVQSVLSPLDRHLDISYTLESHPSAVVLTDAPLSAVKSKKDSTLWAGIHSLKNRVIDAFITVGNTGALMATAHYLLEPLLHAERPALMAKLPHPDRTVMVLDVGANSNASARQLYQFAMMGSAYFRAMGRREFHAGILNIGSEEHKGKAEHKELYGMIKELHRKNPDLLPYFVGNVEPQDVLRGRCDLVITDGFAGNIFLKSAEGTAQLIQRAIRHLPSELLTESQVHGVMQALNPFFDHQQGPGALLIGLDGLVIKCHSYFDGKALYHAIKHALQLIEGQLMAKLSRCLSYD